MTPKEKALELINKFDGYTHYAEWVVDEIKSLLYDADRMIQYDYWYEVKQEIEKL
jgi:hypothetical protein